MDNKGLFIVCTRAKDFEKTLRYDYTAFESFERAYEFWNNFDPKYTSLYVVPLSSMTFVC